ncbi:DUF1642 domain-containing protein [Streptococcus infantis]|uniref:DUF1642 domain-containing protein n=1 Tax=Streptococcus infantis TaxID=68892 RepID=UPI0039C1E085
MNKQDNQELRTNKQELISKYELIKNSYKFDTVSTDGIISDLKRLDEPQKVTIPQFVADWIANVKRNGFKFRNSSRFYEEIVSSDDVYRVMYYILKESIAGEAIRIWVNANRDTFARAWLDGYEVGEEKRYYIRLKNVDKNYNYLNRINHLDVWCLTEIKKDKKFRTTHTRKQLEDAGFGEVFNSTLFEVEEVEE